jgi:endonuclease/exonuclease/phosphatase family metal-dependent hydrolase
MATSRTLRIVTYNVHSCVGTDSVRSVERIADVLLGCRADVIALQEVDVGRPRSEGIDQAEALAVRLGMTHCFGAALHDGAGHYGNAVLSRERFEHIQTAKLPGLRIAEPRCFVHVRVSALHSSPLELFVTHFGLGPLERYLQARALRAAVRGAPSRALVVGDLNTLRGAPAYSCLERTPLRDAQRMLAPRELQATFPSWRPLLRLDHAFVGAGWDVLEVEVPSGPAIERASDHRPLIVTLSARDASAPAVAHRTI